MNTLTRNLQRAVHIPAALLVGLTACLIPHAASAQESARGRSVEDAILADISRITGASRFEQSTSEAPASVSVVSRQDIDRYGWRTLAELLQSVRGFQVTSDRNYNYLSARGFGHGGDWNSRVLLLLNGVRVNDNVFDGAYIGDASVVSIDMIDRVEIIRGPSSSLYGASAVFGVINVITRRGRDVNAVSANVEAGSYGSYVTRVSSGKRLASGLEYFVAGTTLNRQGQDLYFPEFDTPGENHGRAIGLDGASRQSVFGSVAYGGFKSYMTYSNYDKTVPTASYETVFGAPGSPDQQLPPASSRVVRSHVSRQFDGHHVVVLSGCTVQWPIPIRI